MDKEMNRMAQLVVAKPRREVNMAGLVKAAQLYMKGETGENAFSSADRDGWRYAFVPPQAAKMIISQDMRDAAILIFRNALKTYPCDYQFLPCLLTCLCGDLLDEKTAQWVNYSSENCGYADDKNGLQIRLEKSIDYCSYHDVSLSFIGTKWSISIEGCWRGSEGDSGGPVYRPKQYEGCVKGSGNKVISHKLDGWQPDEGFALWGVDLARLGIKVAKQKTA